MRNHLAKMPAMADLALNSFYKIDDLVEIVKKN